MKKLLSAAIAFTACSFLLAAEVEPTSTRTGNFQSKVVLAPFREALISSRLDGVLVKYNYRSGEKFEAGAVLAELDNRRNTIEVTRATEQFKFAEVAYNNQKTLYDKTMTSEYEYRKAENEMNISKFLLAEATLNLSFCTISAPFAGRVEEIFTREHETVRSGQQLFRIIDDNQLLAVVYIPMAKLEKYKLGAPVKVSLPDQKLTAAGKVFEIMPQADPRSGTIQIKALIDNKDGVYTAGMTGTLEDE